MEETTTFTSDSQLLSELGERLIATPQIALSELVKNAYDADATRCNIWLKDDNQTLVVDDDGHGMTQYEFENHWMTIATSNRGENPTSKRYNREVQGSKGVGRFAVRNLGLRLELDTVARDLDADEYRRLSAEFDWTKFESGSGLQEMEVTYRVTRDATVDDEGTRLMISELTDEWSSGRIEEVSNEVLDIVSAPYEPNPSEIKGNNDDPGFSVYFAPPGKGTPAQSIASEIYDRYVAKIGISTDDNTLTYHYEYNGAEDRTYKYNLAKESRYGENLVGDIVGDIRFIPQRRGVLEGMETTDGRKARGWLSDNGGVRVIDNKFRIPPYGDQGNDWIGLSASQARRARSWESSITRSLFPEEDRDVAEATAMLRLPRKSQLLGSVHIDTYRPGRRVSAAPNDRLVSAMDRQGIVENDAYQQLVEIIRGSLEILGVIDALEQQRQRKDEKEEEATEATKSAKDSVSSTKEIVEESESIPETAKQEILDRLNETEERIDDQAEAAQEAREAVESMNVLGVISAFMSHETSLIVDSASDMLEKWEQIPPAKRSPELQEAFRTTERALNDFRTYQSYAQSIMNQLSMRQKSAFKSYAQVNRIIDTFSSYTDSRSIKTLNEIARDVETPELNVGMYLGVLTNLYTNAMKAVIQTPVGDDGRLIRFDAENTAEWHKVRVIDNGIGITREEQTRMFEPWFTTSNVEGPTGVGHGLGLYIVKNVVETVDGEISLVKAPDRYETAFEVRFPR